MTRQNTSRFRDETFQLLNEKTYKCFIVIYTTFVVARLTLHVWSPVRPCLSSHGRAALLRRLDIWAAEHCSPAEIMLSPKVPARNALWQRPTLPRRMP